MRFDYSRIKGYKSEFEIPEKELKVKENSFLFADSKYKRNSRTARNIGLFYETLHLAMFGGEKYSHRTLSSTCLVVPDSTNHGEGVYREAKAVGPECKLFDGQTNKHLLLQLGYGQLKSPRFFYDLFFHNLVGIVSRTKGDMHAVAAELAASTKFMLSLPFEIIWKIHKAGRYRAEYRYDMSGSLFTEQLTRFSARQIYDFITNPRAMLGEYGFNPDDYVLRRKHLKGDIEVLARSADKKRGVRVRITPFPILLVEHKEHKLWFSKFRKRIKRDIKKVKEDIKSSTGESVDDTSDIPF